MHFISPDGRTHCYKNGSIMIDFIAGPILHSPVTNIEVKLHHFEMTPGTVLPVISACASACIYKAFEEAECFLMEPIMFMEVRHLIFILITLTLHCHLH